ncbi:flagellar basal body P-ring formation chaperone FlgA [Trichlorobacter ammonificans]|uniref:Flagella basal body P-ring formation protein FlgA n=1 Tax=Trichlorobacter ammonificans TaxID=2916410 RepID=A0ABM9D442_9BACT|nr:flagellar basal body P-ring formation chaperone FlgA [Trichlorobacter ammonificans]CAH2030010.1 Flagellar basal-body P-ring formation protein flgA [Trichlorobacter ammonificans]
MLQPDRRFIGVLLVLFILVVPGLVAAAQVPLPEKEIRTAVNSFLESRLADRGWQTIIRQLSVPQGHTVPKGARDYEVIAPASWPGWGAVSLAVVVRVGGVVEKNLPVRLVVDAQTEMVVATRQLLSGTVLGADDVALRVQDLALAGGHHIKTIADAVGRKTRVTVRAGYPVRNDQLVTVPVVVSGQLVTIVLERPGLRITVAGRAKSSGGVGDLIRVENLSSRKEIPARVVDASTVEVGF